jgi:hypothetical protein
MWCATHDKKRILHPFVSKRKKKQKHHYKQNHYTLTTVLTPIMSHKWTKEHPSLQTTNGLHYSSTTQSLAVAGLQSLTNTETRSIISCL